MQGAASNGDELDALDQLPGQSRRSWDQLGPGRSRELLLQARAGYLALNRPADVGWVDTLLRDQLVAVHDRGLAWDLLLGDVGWCPGPPQGSPMVVGVDCLGEQHPIAIGGDFTIVSQPSPVQAREHVAAALTGVEPGCVSQIRELAAVRVWASCWQRLAPAPGEWFAPQGLGWVRPEIGAHGWAVNSLGGEGSSWPATSGPASPSCWGIGEGLARAVFDHQVREFPAPRPSPEASAEAQLKLGSPEAVADLWSLGIHPEVVTAICARLGLDRPVLPATLAHLTLRRQVGSPNVRWVDDPLPVGVLAELLGKTEGAERAAMCQFLAAAGGARDRDDPVRLLGWWQESEVPPGVRIQLHRGGFDPADLRRWAKGRGVIGPQQLAGAMARTTPWRSSLPGRPDLLGRVMDWIQEPVHGREAPVPKHSCHLWSPKVREAIDSEDLGRLLRTVTALDREHPDVGPARGECPLWVAACTQLMAALHPTQPRAAAVLRETLLREVGHRQARVAWVWVVLEWAQHRLVSPFPPDVGEQAPGLLFELLERPPRPGSSRTEWVDRFGPAAGLAWPRLRRSGLTVEQAVRWQPPSCSDADYICWLADYLPHPSPFGAPGPDPITWLIGEARRRARRWAAQDHSWLYGPDTYLEESQTRHCLEQLLPDLERALDCGDPTLIDTAAGDALAGHTYCGDYKAYRYHLDTCPVDELARLVLGVAAFPDRLPEAGQVLIGDTAGDDGAAEQVRYPSAVCMTGWLALTHQTGRLVEDDPLRAKWDRATRTSPEGPWLLGMVLEGFSSQRHHH